MMADILTPGVEAVGRAWVWNLKVIVPSSSPAFKLDKWSIFKIFAASWRSATKAFRGILEDTSSWAT